MVKINSFLLMSDQNFPCSGMFLLPADLLLCSSEKSVSLFSLHPLSSGLQTAMCPLGHLLSRLNKPTSSCIPLPPPISVVSTFQCVSIFLLLGSPELDTMGSNQCWIERKDHSPGRGGCTLANATHNTIVCLCCRGTSLGHVQLFAYHDPQVLFWLTPPSSQCPPLLVHGFITSQKWDLAFSVAEFQ